MADVKTHTLDLKLGSIHLQADVYTSDSGTLYCQDTDTYDIPAKYTLDYLKIIESLSNMVSGLGELNSLKIKPIDEEWPNFLTPKT